MSEKNFVAWHVTYSGEINSSGTLTLRVTLRDLFVRPQSDRLDSHSSNVQSTWVRRKRKEIGREGRRKAGGRGRGGGGGGGDWGSKDEVEVEEDVLWIREEYEE